MLMPGSKLGRMLVYVAAMDLALIVLQLLMPPLRFSRAALTLWIWLVSTCFCCLLSVVVLRWFRRRVMWRLRNRLIVTYVFIGVIPVVLLLAMGTIASYLFAGQFATFVITSDLRSETKALDRANTMLAETLVSQLKQGISMQRAVAAISPEEGVTVTLWAPDSSGTWKPYVIPRGAAAISQPRFAEHERKVTGIVNSAGNLYLRAALRMEEGPYKITVIASRPLDRSLLRKIAVDLGEIAIYPPEIESSGHGSQSPNKNLAGPYQQEPVPENTQQSEALNVAGTLPPIRAGTAGPRASRFDRSAMFGAPLPIYDWSSGNTVNALLTVHTRPSLLYRRLFVTLGQFVGVTLLALGFVIAVFAIIELVALIIGIRLTRTVTRSVAALYDATQHINRGDLKHRITVTSQDQLATLENSFNAMSDSLEQLLAEQKVKQRMENELAIAKVVQSQLFPQESPPLTSLELCAVCRPARTVSGDYYDFLPLGPEKLGIAVGDISGKGISAALLMATIRSAVHVYDSGHIAANPAFMAAGATAPGVTTGGRSGIAANGLAAPAEMLTMLNGHLFRSTLAEQYATLFLGVWDGASCTLTYSNGGHLPPLILGRNGERRKLDVGGIAIGLFDNIKYEEATLQLVPGDIFIAYSDGVTEPENEFGEFGEERFLELILTHQNQPLSRISEAVVGAVQDWIGANEQPDDITLVLARAR